MTEVIPTDVLVLIALLGALIFAYIILLLNKYYYHGQDSIVVSSGPNISRNIYREEKCPICLEISQSLVLTSCSHFFCEACILRIWSQNYRPSLCRCPVCRQEILTFFPADLISPLSADFRLYNNQHNGSTYFHTFMQYRELMNCLISYTYAQGRNFFNDRISVYAFLYILFAAWYIIMPFDLIPDTSPGAFGFIDDIFVCILITIQLLSTFREMFLA